MEERDGRGDGLTRTATIYREVYSLYTTTQKLGDPAKRRDIVSFVRALSTTLTAFRRADEAIYKFVAGKVGMDAEIVRPFLSLYPFLLSSSSPLHTPRLRQLHKVCRFSLSWIDFSSSVAYLQDIHYPSHFLLIADRSKPSGPSTTGPEPGPRPNSCLSSWRKMPCSRRQIADR